MRGFPSEVHAKAGFSAPPTQLGVQNFVTCPRTSEWDASCFERWAMVGNASASNRWYATSGSSSNVYRSGQYVRGLIMVNFGTVYVYEARAKVVYQVLDGPPLGAVSWWGASAYPPAAAPVEHATFRTLSCRSSPRPTIGSTRFGFGIGWSGPQAPSASLRQPSDSATGRSVFDQSRFPDRRAQRPSGARCV